MYMATNYMDTAKKAAMEHEAFKVQEKKLQVWCYLEVWGHGLQENFEIQKL